MGTSRPRFHAVAPSAGNATVLSRLLGQMVGLCPFVPFFFFMLPMGAAYSLVMAVASVLAFVAKIIVTPRAVVSHKQRVKRIQDQVLAWKASGSKTAMCTARSQYQSISFQTLTYKRKLHQISLDLPHVLSLDTDRKVVHVEPNVTIGQLNDYLIAKGWTLPVVPELDDLTIGGLVMGGGIETTSHKYGLFQYICKSYEVVLSDGSVQVCSATANPELFFAIPFSYGTLCFLTAVEIDVVPYKPFIRMTYHPVRSQQEAHDILVRESNDDSVDSVEGIMFSEHEGVIMSGVFEDECPNPAKLNKIGRWYKPWFYLHVETLLDSALSGKRDEDEALQSLVDVEYLPTLDFFHRHTRPMFWLVEYLVPFGNNVVFRWLFGWALPPKVALIKWINEKMVPGCFVDRLVAQDFALPVEHLPEALAMSERETGIYPLWLCPIRHFMPKGTEHLAYFKRELGGLHVDLGIYGFSPLPDFEKVACQKRMERFIIDHKGFVALYAETELSLDDFNEMLSHNTDVYNKLRKELNCETAFPHVYEKISKLGRK